MTVATFAGGGKISKQHLVTLLTITEMRIGGICDLSTALARFTAERFGVTDWFTDYREMMAKVKPGVVHVLTPPATHDRIVRDCLAAGCHVIGEKPVALCRAGFMEFWQEADSRGLRLVDALLAEENRL